MANLDERSIREGLNLPISIYRAPWRLGVAHAFNFGVALAANECVLMLGADDTLEPTCLEDCHKTYDKVEPNLRGLMYYHLPLRYMDTGEEQNIPCAAAMVTKSLWKRTGGFPPESAVGASDTMLLSIFMTHPKLAFNKQVGGSKPLYNYRRHEFTDTRMKSAWQLEGGPIYTTRDLLAREWTPPQWGRYI